MVIPERVTPAGITLAEQKLHGGLGFDKMFDCFEYVGYSREETRKKYHRKSQLTENRFSTVVGEDLTDRFSMKAFRVAGETCVNFAAHYAVAIVIAGSGRIKTAEEAIELQKSDHFFITADSGDLWLSGDLDLIFCIA